MLCFFTRHLHAQVIVTPAVFTATDSITITYNAAQGNAALDSFTGPVYMHTGLITSSSSGPGDWQHVVDNWGTDDANTLMTPLGGHLYSKKIFIPSFYSIDCTSSVDSLAFVFRNVDGSLVGRDSAGGDIFAAVAPSPGAGVITAGDYVSHSQDGNKLHITGTGAAITMEVYESGIRVLMQQDTAIAFETSAAIVDTLLRPVTPVVTANSATISFAFDSLHNVVINKSPLTLMLVRGTDTLFNEQQGWQGSACDNITDEFRIYGGEAFFGGGSRPQSIDLRGKKLQLYNQAHYGFNNSDLNLNISIPFFVSSRGYGVFFDNHTPGYADIGQSDPALFKVSFEGGPMRYFIVPGASYGQITGRYAITTGHHELPPIWALGYIQSKYGFETDAEACSVVSGMKEKDFPIDGLVLDLYWFGSADNMGNLSWDNSRFPHPLQMMQDFKDSGVKTILIAEPYFTQASSSYSAAAAAGYFAKNSIGQPYVLSGFWAGSASLLDITNPSAKTWFWNLYAPHVDEGVGGWWSDLGEPETHPDDMLHNGGTARQVHNIFALQWEQLLHDKYSAQYPGKRLFNLCRSGYAGMQRYNTYPWSGDVERSWSGIQAQIPIMINMGMSGVAYMHHDVGGFTNGAQNNELYTRWQQLGAFSPVDRAHGSGVPTVPIDYPQDVQDNVRSFIKLRMSLLPYNYTLAWLNATTGAPLVRSLFYDQSGFTQQYNKVNDEYLWGPNILVAPILNAGQTSRQVVLPDGTWFDWWTGRQYAGQSTVSINTPLTRMPLLIRGDAFLPTTPAVSSTDKYDTRNLAVHYYPADTSKTASFTLYNDDGANPASLVLVQYSTMSFTGGHSPANDVVLFIGLTQQGAYSTEPASRLLTYIVHNFDMPLYDSVLLITSNHTTPLAAASSLSAFQVADTTYFYDTAGRMLYTKSTIDHGNSILKVKRPSVIIDTASGHDFTLLPAYPNPFHGAITVQLNVFEAANYTIRIRNIAGQEVYVQSTDLTKGYQSFNCASYLASGIYMISAQGNHGSQTQRVVLVQ